MSEIESLSSQVQQFGASSDRWANIVMLLMLATAVVGVLYFGATVRQSSVAKKLRAAQDAYIKAKDRELATDLKAKDVEIANAKGAASEADRQAGIANTSAGTANERAGKLEKEAADARRETEKLREQNLETAARLNEANAKLAEEQKIRLELE
jgi:hypothetical protein